MREWERCSAVNRRGNRARSIPRDSVGEKGCFETEFGPFNPITACPWQSQRTSLSTYFFLCFSSFFCFLFSFSIASSRPRCCGSFLELLLLSFCFFSSYVRVTLLWSLVPELLSLSLARSRSVSHGAHACMHAFRSEDGSTRFRPGSRLSFSSRRREPQLVKKLPDRLGARRADSAVVYDPTPNTLSGLSTRTSLPCTPYVYIQRTVARSCSPVCSSAIAWNSQDRARVFPPHERREPDIHYTRMNIIEGSPLLPSSFFSSLLHLFFVSFPPSIHHRVPSFSSFSVFIFLSSLSSLSPPPPFWFLFLILLFSVYRIVDSPCLTSTCISTITIASRISCLTLAFTGIRLSVLFSSFSLSSGPPSRFLQRLKYGHAIRSRAQEPSSLSRSLSRNSTLPREPVAPSLVFTVSLKPVHFSDACLPVYFVFAVPPSSFYSSPLPLSSSSTSSSSSSSSSLVSRSPGCLFSRNEFPSVAFPSPPPPPTLPLSPRCSSSSDPAVFGPLCPSFLPSIPLRVFLSAVTFFAYPTERYRWSYAGNSTRTSILRRFFYASCSSSLLATRLLYCLICSGRFEAARSGDRLVFDRSFASSILSSFLYPFSCYMPVTSWKLTLTLGTCVSQVSQLKIIQSCVRSIWESTKRYKF